MSVTPIAGNASVVTSGGTAVVAVLAVPAGINGGFITNPLYAADQGIATAENLYVDITGNTPGSTAGSGNGTTVALSPGQTYPLVPGQTTAVLVNAASPGHKFTCIVF